VDFGRFEVHVSLVAGTSPGDEAHYLVKAAGFKTVEIHSG
jgi:hypothetical protein